MNPASLPKYIAVITVIAVTGLNPGIGANIILPIDDSAIIIAISIILFMFFSLFSKRIKNGTQDSMTVQSDTQAYCLSLKIKVPAVTRAGIIIQRII